MSERDRFVFGVIILFEILFLDQTKGCHLSPTHCHDQNETDLIDYEYDIEIECDTGHRRKREALFKTEDFMADCMDHEMPDQEGNMPTIVDYVMRHTIWYRKTNSYYCVSDTVECWNHYVSYVMRWDSMYMSPCKNCIVEYGQKEGKELEKSDRIAPKLMGEGNKTSPVGVDEFITLLNEQLPAMSPYDQSMFDLKGLVRFFTNDFICTSNFCNCSDLLMDLDEKCGETWVSRIVGATKNSSKLRIPLLNAANEAISMARKRRDEEKKKRYILIHKLLLLLLKTTSNNTNSTRMSSNSDK